MLSVGLLGYEPQSGASIRMYYRNWKRSEGSKVLSGKKVHSRCWSKIDVLIWDGRDYFLHAVEEQRKAYVKEWYFVVDVMDDGINQGSS